MSFSTSHITMKKKENGKNKEYIPIKCSKCGTEYLIEKFYPPPRITSKMVWVGRRRTDIVHKVLDRSDSLVKNAILEADRTCLFPLHISP